VNVKSHDLQVMKVLESFHVWYWASMRPDLDQLLTNKKEALKFLLSYAFGGRAGAPKSYWTVALYCVEQFCKGDNPEKDAARIWNEFKRRVTKANPDRNPLNSEKKGPAVLLFDFTEVHSLLSQGKTQDAFDHLRAIRGIGPKIAAFFLRDVADFYGLYQPSWNAEQNFYMQPIDVWLEKVAQFLAIANGTPPAEVRDAFGYDQGSRDRAVAAWAISSVCRAENVNPLHFNQGAWFFASTEQHLRYLLDAGRTSMVDAAVCIRPYLNLPTTAIAALHKALPET
jgi:hypothetical protein